MVVNPNPDQVLVSSADMDLRLGVARVSELPSASDDATAGASAPAARAAAGPPTVERGTSTTTSTSTSTGRDNNLSDVIAALDGGGGGPTPNDPGASAGEHDAGYTFDCRYIALRG